jgi:uncharacterized protein YndB with AHSA1/START domain
MDDTTIHYVIYIASTPENLWDTLTNPEALKKNWGIIESQWTVGSPVHEKRAAAASVVYFPSDRHWRTNGGEI